MALHSHSRPPPPTYQRHAASAGLASTRPAPVVRPVQKQLRTLELVLVAGLAGVFLVNALVAVFEPSDFTGLVERSLVGRVVPSMSDRWIAWVIAVHDLTIGVLLVATMWLLRARPFVLAWSGIWLLAVALVKLTALEAFGG